MGLTAATTVVQRQNGRNVFAFHTTSGGATVPWGPLPASWTVSLYLWVEQPVDRRNEPNSARNDLNGLLGVGAPMVLLSSSTPRGGAPPNTTAS